MISNKSMSPIVNFALATTLRIASIGATKISFGSTPATALATIRAIGFAPKARAFESEATTTIAAPSLNMDEFPAVTTPSARNDGFKLASASSDASARGPSSKATTVALLARDPHRHDFGAERAGLLRGDGPALTFEREEVEIAAGDAESIRGVFGRFAHRPMFKRTGQTVEKHGIDKRSIARFPARSPAVKEMRRVAHAFDTAG